MSSSSKTKALARKLQYEAKARGEHLRYNAALRQAESMRVSENPFYGTPSVDNPFSNEIPLFNLITGAPDSSRAAKYINNMRIVDYYMNKRGSSLTDPLGDFDLDAVKAYSMSLFWPEGIKPPKGIDVAWPTITSPSFQACSYCRSDKSVLYALSTGDPGRNLKTEKILGYELLVVPSEYFGCGFTLYAANGSRFFELTSSMEYYVEHQDALDMLNWLVSIRRSVVSGDDPQVAMELEKGL